MAEQAKVTCQDLNNVQVIDRTYAPDTLISGIDSMKHFRAAYIPMRPSGYTDIAATPATADIISLIGSDLVSSSDLVVLLAFNALTADLGVGLPTVNIFGFNVKETYSDFKRLNEHPVFMVVGSDLAAGRRITRLDHQFNVIPLGDVNVSVEYNLFHAVPPVNMNLPAPTVSGGLTLPLITVGQNQQKGMVLPIPLRFREDSAGAVRWQALIFKNANTTGVNITAIPLVGHSVMGKLVNKVSNA